MIARSVTEWHLSPIERKGLGMRSFGSMLEKIRRLESEHKKQPR